MTFCPRVYVVALLFTIAFTGSSELPLGADDSTPASVSAPLAGDFLDRVREELKSFSSARSVTGETEDEVMRNFVFSLGTGGGSGVVPVDGQPFKEAYSLVVPKKLEAEWSAQLSARNQIEIKKGDVIYLTFTARCISSAAEQAIGNGSMVMQGPKDSGWYEHSSVVIPAQWRRFNFTYTAKADVPVQSGQFYLCIGFLRQTIELGGLAMFDLGPGIDTTRLPTTKIDYNYEGCSPDAAWRSEADARIEKYRKADLKIEVIDAAGHPVPGAQVHVEMKKHKFLWGTVVAARMLVENPPQPDDLKLQDWITRYFPMVGFANDLKTEPWTGLGWGGEQSVFYNRKQTMAALHWLNDHDFKVKGHVLVYGQPKEWTSLDKEAFREKIDAHVRDEASATKGLIHTWDVVNEANGNNPAAGVFGNDGIIDWFKTTRAIDPQAKLFINEAAVEQVQASDRLAFFERLSYLTSKHMPFDGIGLESHFSVDSMNPPATIYKILDTFAAFHREIAASELDVNLVDRNDPEQVAAQCDYYRDLLTIYFSHPAVTEIIQWGFWAGDHWLPNAALLNRDWSVRPNGQVFLDLVYKKWWTDVTAPTDAQGTYTTRGYLGEYDITVTNGAQSKTMQVSLDKAGQNVKIELP